MQWLLPIPMRVLRMHFMVHAIVRLGMCSYLTRSGCPNIHFEEGWTDEVREYYHTGRDAGFTRRKSKKERAEGSTAVAKGGADLLEFCWPRDHRPDGVFLYRYPLEWHSRFRWWLCNV